MTVTNDTYKVRAEGNGSGTVFSFSPIVIFASTDIEVTKVDSDGTETTLSEGTGTTNYSVSVSEYPGTGSITYPATLGTELAAGEFIVIKRVLDFEQTVDLENQGGYLPDTQEVAHDKAVMLSLQLKEEIDRSLKIAVTDDTTISTDLPATAVRKGKYLKFHDTTGAPQAVDAVNVTSLSNFVSNIVDDESADEVRQTIGFPAESGNTSNYIRYKSGGDFEARTPAQVRSDLSLGSLAQQNTVATDDLAAALADLLYAPKICQGRLTLSSGVPVTTSDQTAKTTVYFTPYNGEHIDLYTGSVWERHVFSEVSVAVPSTTNTNFDVYIYDNSGTITLGTVDWTNDTTRATALTTIDGVQTIDGEPNKRYLGTCRTTGSSGQTEDSAAKRFVWNMYNRALRPMKVVEATNSWSYSTASYRQANNSATNQIAFVTGLPGESFVEAEVSGVATSSTSTLRTVTVGIGLDGTTQAATRFTNTSTSSNLGLQNVDAKYGAYHTAGYHYLTWLEYGGGADTQTWYGDNGGGIPCQSGITGRIQS